MHSPAFVHTAFSHYCMMRPQKERLVLSWRRSICGSSFNLSAILKPLGHDEHRNNIGGDVDFQARIHECMIGADSDSGRERERNRTLASCRLAL